MRSILFVCTANICRSPMAEGVLRALLQRRGLDAAAFEVDSAATHDFQVGKPPHDMAVAASRRRGYEIAAQVARRVSPSDFDRFDLILAMDRNNLSHLHAGCPTRCKQKVELLLEYGDRFHGKDVPDPYGGTAKDFERTLDMIEDGCNGLATLLAQVARPRVAPTSS